MRLFKLLLLALAVGVIIGLVAFRSVKAQSTQQPYVLQITSGGTSSFVESAVGVDGVSNPELDAGVDFADDGGGDSASATSGAVINRTVGQGTGQGPSMNGGKKPKSNPVLNQSFDGLNFRQQRLANNGNQFSVEPPDQGLCAGNGFVVEAVNDVLRVFDTAGNPALGVVDLNTFFGYAPAIVRPRTFGPSITDPSCYFDPDTQRWFVVVLTLDRVGTTSALAGTNHLDIAVSTTSSPLGTFTIFHLPVQNDGTQGTPDHNCQRLVKGVLVHGPCLGDFPHIGADANGVYFTTNEFNFFAPGFRASQIYAIPKETLASAVDVPVFLFDTVDFPLDGNPGFTVWPATTPAMAYEGNAGGTEYFLSSVAVFNASQTDNRLRMWALSNTQSLSSSSPSLALNSSFIGVDTYGRPPRADQMAGDVPLGSCINDTTTVITSLGPPFTGCWQAITFPEPAHTEVESQHVDSGDSRMMQVVFANGKLWGALDTAVSVGGATKAGIAFYVINPSVTSTSISGSIVQQGVLALGDNNLTYPAVGVTASGRGVIAFTVIGAGGATNPGNFPSAGFAALDALVGAGPLQIAAAGLGPDDGFTSYKAFVGPRGRNRWGDYGAAVADGNTIWMASEYIAQTCTFSQYISAPFGSCGGTRASLGNWATRITQVTP